MQSGRKSLLSLPRGLIPRRTPSPQVTKKDNNGTKNSPQGSKRGNSLKKDDKGHWSEGAKGSVENEDNQGKLDITDREFFLTIVLKNRLFLTCKPKPKTLLKVS